jgi:hypothetical protein
MPLRDTQTHENGGLGGWGKAERAPVSASFPGHAPLCPSHPVLPDPQLPGRPRTFSEEANTPRRTKPTLLRRKKFSYGESVRHNPPNPSQDDGLREADLRYKAGGKAPKPSPGGTDFIRSNPLPFLDFGPTEVGPTRNPRVASPPRDPQEPRTDWEDGQRAERTQHPAPNEANRAERTQAAAPNEANPIAPNEPSFLIIRPTPLFFDRASAERG